MNKMATTRILRIPTPPLRFQQSCSQHFLTKSIFDCSSNFHNVRISSIVCKQRLNGEVKPPGVGGSSTERQVHPAPPQALLASAVETKTDATTLDFASFLAIISNVILHNFKVVRRRKLWKLYIQMFVEKVIIDCRFFTLFAVAGSMIGSVLCFIEGCFLVLDSYLQYFHAVTQRSDQGHIMQLLIESLDMFLIGAAMLTFGMSLHVMFVGSNRDLQSWGGAQSLIQAKSRIGHAVMLLLQVGVLEKFKNIPVVSGFDLACFAAAVFASSASTFLLSRLAFAPGTSHA